MYKFLFYALALALYIISFIFFKKELIDRTQSIYEKIIIVMLFLMVIIPAVLYIIDSYNLPSVLGFNKFVSLERWTNFVFDYVGIICGGVLSGMILLGVTILQIKSQKENDREDRRIKNLPLVDYRFAIFGNYDTSSYDISLCKSKKNKSLCLSIYMKNIGMNRIRKCYINISSDLIVDEFDYEIGSRELLKMSDEYVVNSFAIPIIKGENHLIITVKYQDILFNWYTQEIKIVIDKIRFNNIYDAEARINETVFDEVLISGNVKLKLKQVK